MDHWPSFKSPRGQFSRCNSMRRISQSDQPVCQAAFQACVNLGVPEIPYVMFQHIFTSIRPLYSDETLSDVNTPQGTSGVVDFIANIDPNGKRTFFPYDQCIPFSHSYVIPRGINCNCLLNPGRSLQAQLDSRSKSPSRQDTLYSR